MRCRHCEVQLHTAGGARRLRAFHQMLLEGRARGDLAIFMESEQRLGQLAIVHAVRQDDSRYHIVMAAGSGERAGTVAIQTAARGIKLGYERQLVKVSDDIGHGGAGGRLFVATVDKSI